MPLQIKTTYERVELLPLDKQINSMYRLPDANFLNEMLSCHTEGCTISDLVDSIKDQGVYTQSYLYGLPRQLNRGYHFLGIDGNIVYANEVSEAYAQGNIEPMMLAAFRNFFLLAELLEWCNRNTAKRPREIIAAVNQHYSGWTSDKQTMDRIWWLRFFGLITPSVGQNMIAKKISITEKGKAVLAGMDFTDRSLIGSIPDNEIRVQLRTVGFQTLLEDVQSDSELIVDIQLLKSIHNGFHANASKRFIILSGLSGTGKTKILQRYAEAYCTALDIDSYEQVRLVSITPAFKDHTHLLGYLNSNAQPPRYIHGELTQFLLNATANPEYPFFLILDEMNLAQVEFYFSSVLSAMESGTQIVFHDTQDIDFPSSLRCWPSNVFLAGTVNMDETTHTFSDKVLDRAFTIEFWDVNLTEYFTKHPTHCDVQHKIHELYDVLHPAHLHFGYRTVKAIVDYVDISQETDPNDLNSALDQAVFSKVLPKLRGQQSDLLTDTVRRLLLVCMELPMCKEKIQAMQHRLSETGATQFWR